MVPSVSTVLATLRARHFARSCPARCSYPVLLNHPPSPPVGSTPQRVRDTPRAGCPDLPPNPPTSQMLDAEVSKEFQEWVALDFSTPSRSLGNAQSAPRFPSTVVPTSDSHTTSERCDFPAGSERRALCPFFLRPSRRWRKKHGGRRPVHLPRESDQASSHRNAPGNVSPIFTNVFPIFITSPLSSLTSPLSSLRLPYLH